MAPAPAPGVLDTIKSTTSEFFPVTPLGAVPEAAIPGVPSYVPEVPKPLKMRKMADVVEPEKEKELHHHAEHPALEPVISDAPHQHHPHKPEKDLKL